MKTCETFRYSDAVYLMEASDLIFFSDPVERIRERCHAMILDIYFSRSRNLEG